MNTHSNCVHCNNKLEEWECELIRPNYSPIKPVVKGNFRVGVSSENISQKYKYSYLNAAKVHARELTEKTGIQFHVYEETTVYRPVS